MTQPFTEDFNGTTNQDLTAYHPAEWILPAGMENCLYINAGKLAKRASTGAFNCLLRPDDGAINNDFTFTQVGVVGCPLFLVSVTGATIDGYIVQLPSATSFRLHKIDANSISVGSLHTVNVTAGVPIQVTASIVGGNPKIKVFQNGVQLSSTGGQTEYNDTSATKKTGTRRGIFANGTGASSSLLEDMADNSTVPASFAVTPRSARFVEGVLAAGQITHTVTYSTPPTSIEARLVDGSGNPLSGFNWSVKVASPAGTSANVSFTGLSTGGPYTMQVRDSANPGTVISSESFWCGAVLPINDQSIHQIMADNGRTPAVGALTTTQANAQVFVLYASTRLNPAAAPVFTRLNTLNAYGSGYMAMADQIAQDWPAHIPIMFVDIAFSGQEMSTWINDATPATSTWPLRTGFAATLFGWANNRITALIRPVVVNPNGYTVAQAYDALIPLYDAVLTNQPGGAGSYQVWVQPVQRASRPYDNTGIKALREGAYAVGMRGGRWRLLSAIGLGTRAVQNGDIHQADGVNPTDGSAGGTAADPVAHQQGNQLVGRLMGRGVVSLLQSLLAVAVPIDRLGARIQSVDFTDATMTAVKITFDRQVRTVAGTTVSLPQHWTTANGWTAKTELTGDLQSDQRSVVCQVPAGSLRSFNLRYDYARDTPFDTTGGANGGELAVQAKLDTLLTDTSTFNGGRGMPVFPELTAGIPVRLPIPIVATNATGTVVLRAGKAA